MSCINVKSRDPVHFKVSLESLHVATKYTREVDRVTAFKRYRMCTEILMVMTQYIQYLRSKSKDCEGNPTIQRTYQVSRGQRGITFWTLSEKTFIFNEALSCSFL